jgi:SprB repeat
MRKIYLLLLFVITVQTATAQTVTISVPQYQIIVERCITRKAAACTGVAGCYQMSAVKYQLAAPGTIVQRISDIGQIPIGDSITLYDTIPVVQLQNPVLSVTAELGAGIPVRDRTGSYTFSDLTRLSAPVQYRAFDTSISDQRNPYYNLGMTVKVRPNLDLTGNLPSHDLIRIVAIPKTQVDPTRPLTYNWQYRTGAGDWATIPGSSDTAMIQTSGIGLFGNPGFQNFLNQNVQIRLRAVFGTGEALFSNITIFTHRLSSPRITAIAPTHVGCWGDTTGSLTVFFDRGLLLNERLNILLKDTINRIDYSALNITSLGTGNIYSWPAELLGSTYQVAMIGKYSNQATYTGGLAHYGFTKIIEPPKVRFYVQKADDVRCKGGNSGVVRVQAAGGRGQYSIGWRHSSDTAWTWKPFSSIPFPNCFPATASSDDSCDVFFRGMRAGQYVYKVRDGNGCYTTDSLGNERTLTLSFDEPATALTTETLDISPITHSDSSNGAISTRISGGTPNSVELPYKYSFEWRDSATNQVITNFSLDTTAGKFETGISRLSGGTYIFRAWDGGYFNQPGINTDGCRIDIKIKLLRPDSLRAVIAERQPIACADSSNGKLIAKAAGGVKINGGYLYNWYKLVSGNYQSIAQSSDSVLSGLGGGSYKVSVTDKYGTLKTSPVFELVPPATLAVAVGSTPASCFSNADGSVIASGGGGIGPYTYEWSSGHTTPVVTGLPGGSYAVHVTDSRGCDKLATVQISAPVELLTTLTAVPLTCNAACDAKLQIAVSGGTAPYSYRWSNGSTTNQAQNLCSGRVQVRISDRNGCVKIDSTDIIPPAAFSVNIGSDRLICTGQTITLDATTAAPFPLTYQWSGAGAGSSPILAATLPGSYTVTVSSPSGCIKKDTVVLSPATGSIRSEFVLSSQAFAGDNVLLANISSTRPDSVQWIIPPGNITLINRSNAYLELQFADTGKYRIGMRAFYSSGCVDLIYKDVVVVSKEGFSGSGNQLSVFLKKFRVYPNPNNGNFSVEMEYNAVTKARLRLVNLLTNQTLDDRTVQGQMTYTLPYNKGALPRQLYVLVIETPKGNFIHKVEITQ